MESEDGEIATCKEAERLPVAIDESLASESADLII